MEDIPPLSPAGPAPPLEIKTLAQPHLRSDCTGLRTGPEVGQAMRKGGTVMGREKAGPGVQLLQHLGRPCESPHGPMPRQDGDPGSSCRGREAQFPQSNLGEDS